MWHSCRNYIQKCQVQKMKVFDSCINLQTLWFCDKVGGGTYCMQAVPVVCGLATFEPGVTVM